MQTVYIKTQTIPEAYEKAMIECWENGANFPTEYDKEADKNSRDITAMIHITDPMQEPRIHRSFPGGLEDLEKYVCEVLFGVHDHWVNPEEGKWEYTYHQRLFEYDVPGCACIDQLSKSVEMLKKCPYTRRAQAITWQPWKDLGIGDPACLQRIWLRVEKHECPQCQGTGNSHFEKDDYDDCQRCGATGHIMKLNMNVHIRSNDLYKAFFMNVFAFTELQSMLAEQVGVEMGEYVHVADSLHIYGSYFDEVLQYFTNLKNREFKDRTWSTKFAAPFFFLGDEILLTEDDMPLNKRNIIATRKKRFKI